MQTVVWIIKVRVEIFIDYIITVINIIDVNVILRSEVNVVLGSGYSAIVQIPTTVSVLMVLQGRKVRIVKVGFIGAVWRSRAGDSLQGSVEIVPEIIVGAVRPRCSLEVVVTQIVLIVWVLILLLLILLF